MIPKLHNNSQQRRFRKTIRAPAGRIRQSSTNFGQSWPGVGKIRPTCGRHFRLVAHPSWMRILRCEERTHMQHSLSWKCCSRATSALGSSRSMKCPLCAVVEPERGATIGGRRTTRGMPWGLDLGRRPAKGVRPCPVFRRGLSVLLWVGPVVPQALLTRTPLSHVHARPRAPRHRPFSASFVLQPRVPIPSELDRDASVGSDGGLPPLADYVVHAATLSAARFEAGLLDLAL